MNFRQQLEFNLDRGPFYQDCAPDAYRSDGGPIRLIAYYLPQFHPIPQNDAWWGKGFTEWTNVTKALPRFLGHYQPRLPGELGFYDLRLAAPLRRQAQLARQHGLGGFCFHYYWFNGQKVLETPLANLLANPDIDLPFCINWANENWTRTWSGNENDVLLAQQHSEADDISFASALEPLLRDPRYIRVDGRPLIMLYRPALLPNAEATLLRWRDHFIARGFGNPYLVMTQGFQDTDPRKYGFDAAAEFPPHKVGWTSAKLTGAARCFSPNYDGEILSYDQMVRAAMSIEDPEYVLFRGVCPGFDNESRRPSRGTTFANSNPLKYGDWLAWAGQKVSRANKPSERFVFVNAWNEWAEGAYLEPDRHFGYAYLRETASALAKASEVPDVPITHIDLSTPRLLPSQTNAMERVKAPLRRLRSAWLKPRI